MWEDISSSILKEAPGLETEILRSGTSSCRFFYLLRGFKDIGPALVFGYVEWGRVADSLALLSQLEELARQKKLNQIVGPLNYSTFFDYRLRLDHFDEMPFPGEPKNSESANKALEQAGYQTVKKYYSHEFSTRFNLQYFWLITLVGFWAQLRTKFRFRFSPLSKTNYEAYLPQIFELTQEAFSGNYLYQGIPFDVFKVFFSQSILPYIDVTTSILALDKQGRLAGFSLCLKNPHKAKQLLFKTIAVKKDFRGTATLGRLLMCAVYLAGRKKFDSCLACLMFENTKAEQMFRKMSFATKSYGLYKKDLERTPSWDKRI